jgi:hypothetical protein
LTTPGKAAILSEKLLFMPEDMLTIGARRRVRRPEATTDADVPEGESA